MISRIIKVEVKYDQPNLEAGDNTCRDLIIRVSHKTNVITVYYTSF